MNTKEFLNKVCNEIKYKPVRNEIAEELNSHIQEIKEDYIKYGIFEDEAERKAINQMGDAEEIGKRLDKIHRPQLDWKLMILSIILIGYGIAISIMKSKDNNYSYVSNIIAGIIIGTIFGIGIYFFDYRKTKNFSGLIYKISTILLIIPHIEAISMNINKIAISQISIMLYIISFASYLTKYNQENKLETKCGKKNVAINIDIVRMIVLIPLSLFMIIIIPSISNAIILGISYLFLGTLKIIKEDESKKKKTLLIFGSIFTLMFIFTIFYIQNPCIFEIRFERIISSFNPESDPDGYGYTGMTQKEVIENANLVGKSNTDIVDNKELSINNENIFNLIYLLGRTGILTTLILVSIIILTMIKIINNAKIIKDLYGKFIITGIGFFIIIQFISNILMNINLGIKADVNLPFITSDGVYMAISIINIALIMSIYRRKNINLEV